jgi:hypothetical protein
MNGSRLFQLQYTYERDMCTVFLKATIGASGAPTLVAQKGIVSMVRNSAGRYTITLKNNFNLFLDANYTAISPSAAPAAPGMYIVSETVNSTKTIVIQMNNAGTAADPANGETVCLSFQCRIAST